MPSIKYKLLAVPMDAIKCIGDLGPGQKFHLIKPRTTSIPRQLDLDVFIVLFDGKQIVPGFIEVAKVGRESHDMKIPSNEDVVVVNF